VVDAAAPRRTDQAMHRLAVVQTAAFQTVPEVAPRRWQAEKAGQLAFAATALFAAQLYLSPAQWFPVLEPTHHAAILSVVGLTALLLRRMLSNQPLWMGWRTALLAVYAGAALLSPIWSIAPENSAAGALEVGKHFLFFVALTNGIDTPRRVRVALALYALVAIAPGWGTFNNWNHDELLVEGFRGRWLGVMADPNHDAMALVGALPILLFLTTGHGHRWPLRIFAALGAVACIAGVIATHSRGGSLGLAVAVALFALLSRRKAIAGVLVMVAAAGVLLLAPTSFWQRNETSTLGAEDLSIEGRLQAWQVAERIFHERPILGVGQAAFLDAWNQYAPIDSNRLFGHRYVAHNLVLEVLGQLGLVGLIGLMGFIGASLWSAWKARNGELGGESRALLAALIGYLVCQMFSGYSNSWFLFALCSFATCCDAWGSRRAQETV
jgi:putative inorganic carbon (HCO3(-)) transporter